MSKLLEDPKVAALVEKEVAKAVKAERARVTAIMKTLGAELKDATAAVTKPVAA